MKHRDTSDLTDWAKRVNRGWIVRNGLADRADEWLAHLAQTDPARLLAVCDIARALSRGPDRTIDPKPWFYAGLFSLATAAEARQYLTNHRFTAAAIPAFASDEDIAVWVNGLGPASRDLLVRLRAAVLARIAARVPDGGAG